MHLNGTAGSKGLRPWETEICAGREGIAPYRL